MQCNYFARSVCLIKIYSAPDLDVELLDDIKVGTLVLPHNVIAHLILALAAWGSSHAVFHHHSTSEQ